jgi:polyhydroxybutyrate depolymerase
MAGGWSVLAIAACGHAEAPGAASPLDVPDMTDASGSSVPSAAELLTITVGGRDRMILVHAPVQTTGPVPLVLNLHGSRFTAGEQEQFSGMDRASDAYGFVVAYPQAALPSGTGFEWHVPGQTLLGGRPAPGDAPDDVAFLAEALSAIEQRVAIDPARVFVTGFSGGARMASQLACDLSEKIAAVAPVGGLRFPSPCESRRPVSVIAFHGTADPVNPYEGNGHANWTYGVREAAEEWAAHDGCGAAVVDSDPAPGAQLTTYKGCKGSAAVELYTIKDEGHEWPGGPVMPAEVTKALGPQSNVVDANALMWAFFSAHPAPP